MPPLRALRSVGSGAARSVFGTRGRGENRGGVARTRLRMPLRARGAGPLSLRRNFSWTVQGQVVYAACQMAIMMIIAKLTSPVVVGQYVLAVAIATPVFMLSELQLRAVQATDARGEYRFGDYLGLRLLTVALALVVVLVIGFIAGYGASTLAVVLAVAAGRGFASLSDVYYGRAQQYERMDRIAQSLIAKGVLSVVLLWLALSITGNLVWGALGVAAAYLGTLMWIDLPGGRFSYPGAAEQGASPAGSAPTGRPRWDPPTLGRLVRLTFPLGLMGLLIALYPNIPRYLVSYYFDEHMLGIYGALAALLVVPSTIMGALDQSARPRLAKHFAEGSFSSFTALLTKLCGIGLAVGLAACLFAVGAGPMGLELLYTPEYAQYSSLLVLLTLSAPIGHVGSSLRSGLVATRRFGKQVPISAFMAATMFVACLILIPRWGLNGVAFAWILTVCSQLLLSGVLLARHLRAVRSPAGEHVAEEIPPL